MGMDYTFAGSASYPRFDEELCKIAEFFGGVKSLELKEKEQDVKNNGGILDYWFSLSSYDESKLPKFIFPEGTNTTLVMWFNNIYFHFFTIHQTEIVWECISQHPEIKEISPQIWYELESCVKCNSPWHIKQ